ncbi:MAG: helix-turn-helix domain-containing protein [Caldimonas sp.]
MYTDLVGPSFRFSGARVAYAAPAHALLYESILQCPVLFSQARNELRFDTIRMKDPMAHANPITNAMARDICEQGLAEVTRSGGVALDIHRILVERPGRFRDIDAMAIELGVNERTLRRKLDAENTSYRQILADVRQRLAIEYLRKTQLTNEEIATQLGYSDAANFRHAFMRWTQKHPSDFRVE